MGRPKRTNIPGLTYHIIMRGNNKRAIFHSDEDYKRYFSTVYRYKKKFGFKLFAFCLMNNHVHLLIQVSAKGSISQIMQAVTISHTRHYHTKYKTNGHIWQGRFRSPIVSDDDYLLTAMVYIEKNPVKAGIVTAIGDYKWSSYQFNIRDKSSFLIDREDNRVFLNLGNTQTQRIQNYKQEVNQKITKDKLEALNKSLTGHVHFISKAFEEQLGNLLPRRKKRGRPRMNVLN